MHRRPLHAVFVALVLASASIAAIPQAVAQPSTRAYAPEALWTLTPAEQTRVISLEYREQSGGRHIPNDQLRFYLDQVRLSRWTFSRVRQDIAQSLAGSGGNWRPDPNPGPATIRCESHDSRTRSCPTPWQARSRLVRQLSDRRCVEGQSWYSTPGKVTVLHGCRAEFAAGASQDVAHEVRCESERFGYRECVAGFGSSVSLVRQISETRCTRNDNWGTRGNLIWVDRGCSGIFRVGTDWGGNHGGGYSVSCSSTGNRPQSCAWNGAYGRPYLQRQLSSTRCREGSNWWYVDGKIWVQDGCRALFGTR